MPLVGYENFTVIALRRSFEISQFFKTSWKNSHIYLYIKIYDYVHGNNC